MSALIGFRKAIPEDVNFLVALRIASMHEHLAEAGIIMTDNQHRLTINQFFNDSHLILINNKPIGLLKIAVLPQRLHIRQFQIMPQFHRMGIGSMVLGAVKKKAVALNLGITLNVLLSNPAKKLYQRQGFMSEAFSQLECTMRWDNNG